MEAPPATSDQAAPPAGQLASVHTGNLPDILAQLNISLLVTTYQAGRVILVRGDTSAAGESVLNTHFREFDKPMGACLKQQRLAIGGANTVWEFRNVPAAARHLEPAHRHDACFVPGSVRFTGNIDIHEMAWSADDELWLVNTRFSCLCTLDDHHSFVPRWRPPFVSALAPEDRCHLNGLALRDGRARYVTALGRTDSRGGWRARKADGGILMDVESGEVLAEGLSMPHSPRWHADRLWVLESGQGALAALDAASGRADPVAHLPGFTRGMDFAGPLGFVGLSRIRESAVFSGLPITRDGAERHCGVWVVDLRSGEVVAFLRFESGVDEIFAVQVLPNQRFPELLAPDSPLVEDTYVLPDEALATVSIATEQDFAASAHGKMARAKTHYSRREFEQAVEAFEECLSLDPEFPDARYGLGVALAELGRTREALDHLPYAVEREPERAELQVSLGSLYQRLGDTAAARRAFQEAVRRCPEDPNAHAALAVLELQLGEYRAGFAELVKGLPPSVNEAAVHPLWDGREQLHCRLLIQIHHPDPRQAIPLLRFLPVAADRVAKVLVACPPRLASLLRNVPGVNEVLAPAAVEPHDVDLCLPLEHLPHVLNVFDQFPPRASTCLNLEARRPQRHLEQADTDGAHRVGVAWASADDERPPSAHCIAALRNLLEAEVATERLSLMDLTDRASCGEVPAQLAAWLSDAPCASQDLADLAALVAGLDLVLGVDSAAVHLAGTLGVPGRVVLGERIEWYWPARGEQSEWYPSLRVVRKRDSNRQERLQEN